LSRIAVVAVLHPHFFHPSTHHAWCNRVPNWIPLKTGLEQEIGVTESWKVSEFCVHTESDLRHTAIENCASRHKAAVIGGKE